MSGASTAGERLLRSAEVEQAADQVAREVEMQVAGALAGPVGTTMAALRSSLPRVFIAVGAALTTAYAAVSAGDEVRAAAAMRCAQDLLFPDDPLGRAVVAGAVRPALEGSGLEAGPVLSDDAEGVERRVAAEVEALERGYVRVASQLQAAALGTYSWKQMTGGMGESADVEASQMGMFVDGLARWAFMVEAAIEGVRADDWVRVGAGLVAARRVTSSG